jgi:prophage antirepressor-like protein
MDNNKIQLFENKKVRSIWDAEKGEWFFSVVDVCGALSGSVQPRKYWNDLKMKLKAEGSELSEKIGQLKLPAEDGKMRETDVLDTKGILRLVQSIPSPKAEPFKIWLAPSQMLLKTNMKRQRGKKRFHR